MQVIGQLFEVRGTPWRKIPLWIGVSLLLHALVIGLSPKKPSALAPGPIAHAPMNVVIVSEPQAQPAPAAPPETVAAAPAPMPRPTPPRRVTPPEPAPIAAQPTLQPAPLPLPPPIPAPPVDMMAAIEQRRAQRRAMEASAARGPPSTGPPSEDAAARNLASLSGREGVGGVFQIMRIGTRSAEFAFNGWRPDARSRWREVIEVETGSNPSIEIAIIRRMITLIRTHYTGDFNWESHRMGKVIVLSARPEDNSALEDFMYREFFGVPLVNPKG
jgi:hypothetical protein